MIDKNLVQTVASLLKQKKQKIATAESCTGGLLAHILTNISGSSEYFDRGIISYSDTSKIEFYFAVYKFKDDKERKHEEYQYLDIIK